MKHQYPQKNIPQHSIIICAFLMTVVGITYAINIHEVEILEIGHFSTFIGTGELHCISHKIFLSSSLVFINLHHLQRIEKFLNHVF